MAGWISDDVFEADDGKQYQRVGKDQFVPFEAPKPQQEQGVAPVPENIQGELDIGTIGKSLATELALSAGGQAVGAALAPATLGLSYPIASFAGGFGGSMAAQELEGRDEKSFGRAAFAGVVNMIPFSSAAKGVNAATKITPKLVGEAAKIEAKRGAAIGAAEATSIAIIDRGELPTVEELAIHGGVGTLFGGAIGTVTPKVSKSLSKIFGKSAKQIDDDVISGKITEDDMVNIADMTEQNDLFPSPKSDTLAKRTQEAVGADVPEVAPEQVGLPGIEARRDHTDIISQHENKQTLKTIEQTSNDNGAGIFEKVKAVLSPKRITGRSVEESGLDARANARADEELGSKIENNIDRYIKDSPKRESLVTQALETGVVPNELVGSSIHADLELFSEIREQLQKDLILQVEGHTLSGMTPEVQRALSNTLKESVRDKSYLTREYRVFTDKKFVQDKGKRILAEQEIADGLMVQKGMSQEKAAELAKSHIDNLVDKSAKSRALSTNKAMPQAIDGVLKVKKDPGPAERAFLGEITSPGSRARGTLTRLGKAVYRNEGDIGVMDYLEKAGLAVESPPNSNWVPLQLRSNIDTKLHVPANVELALSKSYLRQMDDKFNDVVKQGVADIYSGAVGLSKAVKVLLNPPSYAVNAYGGMLTMVGQGMNPFSKGYGKGMKYALAQYGSVEKMLSKGGSAARKALLTDMREMSKYDLSNANILESDIRDSFNQGIWSSAIGKKLEPVGKAYSATDTAARYAVWTHNQKQLSSMFPELKGEELKKVAARFTNDTFQNYNKLSPYIRMASRTGVLPQFVAFTAEFMRNIYNQTKYAGQMVRGNFGTEFGLDISGSNLRRMQAEGAKRLASLGTVIAGTEAIRRSWNSDEGIGEAEEEALKNSVVADYDQNKSLMFTMGEDGKSGEYINLSYLSPHAMIAEAFNAALDDKPLDSLGDMVVDQFVGEGNFVASSVYGAIANRDAFGRPITQEKDNLDRFKEQLGFVVTNTFKPGFAREGDKLVDALTNDEPDYSFSDIAKRQLGYRVNKFELGDAKYKIRADKEAVNSAANDYTSKRDRSNLNPEQLELVYRDANRNRQDHMESIAERNASLETLGISEADRIDIMKQGGVGSKDILAVLEGRYEDLKREEIVSTTDLYEADYAPLPDEDIMDKIRELAKTNGPKAKALISEHKQQMIAERRGITSRDEILRGFSVRDRIDYVIDNPDKLEELIQKRIVTKDVMIGLRRMGFKR